MTQPISSKIQRVDYLQLGIEKALDWIAANRQTFFSIAGTSVVVLVIGIFFIVNFLNLRKQAWERYYAGTSWMMTSQSENAMNLFNEVLQNYGHTPAVAYALMSKGDLLCRQKKYEEAIQSYRQALEKKPKQIILPFILTGLSAAQEEKGDYEGAISSYKQFLAEIPDHYMTPEIQSSLARVYELSQNPDRAKEMYEKIITAYPGTAWAERGRFRYQKISPAPFQNSPAPEAGR